MAVPNNWALLIHIPNNKNSYRLKIFSTFFKKKKITGNGFQHKFHRFYSKYIYFLFSVKI